MISLNRLTRTLHILLIAAPLALSACGGGGGESPTPPPPLPPTNTAPKADAGLDQSVISGDLVEMDGTESSDPEDDSLTYSWVQTVGPSGHSVMLGGTASKPHFIAPFTGNDVYAFELTVSDGKLTAVDTVSVDVTKGFRGCVVGPPPVELSLDPTFYANSCPANDISVNGPDTTPVVALEEVANIAKQMLSKHTAAYDAMVAGSARITVMSQPPQVTTDVPEFSDYYTRFPMEIYGIDWDTIRGLGGVIGAPTTLVPEENVLCYNEGQGAATTVHEIAHATMNLGIAVADTALMADFQNAYDAAIVAAIWSDFSFSMQTNMDEYIANATVIFYGLAVRGSLPNGVNQREWLKARDPTIHDLLMRVFPAIDLQTCLGIRPAI